MKYIFINCFVIILCPYLDYNILLKGADLPEGSQVSFIYV